MQRADADQAAVAADQRGAAPERMRRRGKDRAVEQVFPIAGEFLAGDDRRGDRVPPAALGGETPPGRRRRPALRAPISSGGTLSRPSACTRPKPVSWS